MMLRALSMCPSITTSFTVTYRSASAPVDCSTVPAGMLISYPAGLLRRKRTTPVALAPSLRESPRRAAWCSSASPVAVKGEDCRAASSASWQ